jgi:hypothetical protein
MERVLSHLMDNPQGQRSTSSLLSLALDTDPRDSGGYCETAWTAASEGQQVSDSACGEEGGRQDDGGRECFVFRYVTFALADSVDYRVSLCTHCCK